MKLKVGLGAAKSKNLTDVEQKRTDKVYGILNRKWYN